MFEFRDCDQHRIFDHAQLLARLKFAQFSQKGFSLILVCRLFQRLSLLVQSHFELQQSLARVDKFFCWTRPVERFYGLQNGEMAGLHTPLEFTQLWNQQWVQS